jgi:long-chain acyl-CoA synthetase
MLLSANGQNVYPEEIEAVINKMQYVTESLVKQEGEKFIALVFPDEEALKADNVSDIPAKMEELRKSVNKLIPSYEHISEIRVMKEEFEKTPKKSIKRYLYE